MRKNKVVLNYLYNMIYQAVNIIVPIITVPYVTKMLGADGIGVNGYTYPFAALFAGIGMFGIINYGSKNIASSRGSKADMSNKFWSIWSLQGLSCLICSVIYISIFILNDVKGMGIMFTLQFPLILAALLDISWLYVGLEDFKKTVTRNIIVKLIGLILIFTLVKSRNDLGIYILINSLTSALGNATFWISLPKYVNKPDWHKVNFRPHIRGALYLLIPQLSVQIYTTMDRTIIGGISTMTEVGYYDNSQKIARLALVLVTSLSFVMMPRIANMYASNEKDRVSEVLGKSLKFSVFLSIFITSSLISVAKDFVPVFFGEEFLVIIPYMIITSIIVVFISIGGVFANQYSLPTGRSKDYAMPLIIAAIINPIINIILVPSLGALGGVIAIVITEFMVMTMRVGVVKDKLELKVMFKGTNIYIVSGIISCCLTLLLSKYLDPGYISVIIEGIFNGIIYLSIILIMDKQSRLLVINTIIKNSH